MTKTTRYIVYACLLMVSILPFGVCAQTDSSSINIYNGAVVSVLTGTSNSNKKELADIKKQIEDIIRPQKTNSIFRERIYVKIAEPKRKGLRFFVKNKIGKKPVYLNEVSTVKNEQNIKKLLFGIGIYEAEITHQITTKKNHSTINYKISLSKRYRIADLYYPEKTNELSEIISAFFSFTTIKTGDFYDITKIAEERKRINELVRNNGYYFFKESYLFFQADTNKNNFTVDLTLKLRDNIPSESFVKYTISDVFIYPNYSLESFSEAKVDTSIKANYTIIKNNNWFKDKIFQNCIVIRKDSLYNTRNHQLTVKRLIDLGVFKYITVDYIPGKQNEMQCHIYCNGIIEETIKINLGLTSKSNGNTGPGSEISYNNANIFGGAESFSANLNAGFESQFSKNQNGLESFHFGGSLDLIIPRITFPVSIYNYKSNSLPLTNVNIGYQIMNRYRYYSLYSFNVKSGYLFKTENNKQVYELYPFYLNFQKLGKTTDVFNDLLAKNPVLANSFQQQFIPGSQYAMSFKKKEENNNNYYFRLVLENSGNIFGLAHNSFFKKASLEYSQFSKLSSDFRFYRKMNHKQMFAFRFYSGIGIPYGNSNSLPYSKQFFSGGPNSIRAFQSRSLGPGSNYAENVSNEITYFDQTGDIKLEFNLEYRFPIIGYLYGAAFSDIGNIWLLKKQEGVVDGEFNAANFAKQLAVGVGFGLRLDITYFVIRLDSSVPVRFPDQDYLSSINLGNSDWRGQNLVLNLAIGYPF